MDATDKTGCNGSPCTAFFTLGIYQDFVLMRPLLSVIKVSVFLLLFFLSAYNWEYHIQKMMNDIIE